MTLGKVVVKLDGLRRSLDSGLKAVLRRKDTDYSEPVVIVGDSGVCMGVIRIGRDRTVKAHERFCESFFGKTVEVISPAKVVFKRLRAVGAALPELFQLAAGQLWQKHLEDFVRERVFQRQDVRKRFIYRCRPDGCILTDTKQLHRDAQTLTGLLDTAIENEIHVKIAADTDRVDNILAEREDRTCRTHD